MEVDEDNVRMSKFIEGKFNCEFEDGKTFYEATKNEENFLYYRKILRPDIRGEVNDFFFFFVQFNNNYYERVCRNKVSSFLNPIFNL